MAIDYGSGIPVYRQIVNAVSTAISGGKLHREEQLPTIHALAKTLEINPNTVARAYRELETGGYVVALRGRGTFPSDRPSPTAQQREAVLQRICEKALVDGASHALTAEDIGNYLRRTT